MTCGKILNESTNNSIVTLFATSKKEIVVLAKVGATKGK